MKLSDLKTSSNSQTVQSAFARVRVKDYFSVLAEMTGDEKYLELYEQIREYTRLDEYCNTVFFDAVKNTPCNEDATVGEMLFSACETMKAADRAKKNYDPELDDDDGSVQEAAARLIVQNILIIPLSDPRLFEFKKKGAEIK